MQRTEPELERSAIEQLAMKAAQHMNDLGNTIYAFGCAVAATVLGVGIADYWFGHHELTAFLSWAVSAAILWLVSRASLYVLARR
jgi:hypothetical protein